MTRGVPPAVALRSRTTVDTEAGIRLWPIIALFPIIVVAPVKSTGFGTIGGVDTTVLSVAFLLLVTCVSFLRHPRYPLRQMLPFLLFALVVLFGVARSDPGEYQSLKARDFFLLTSVIIGCVPVLLRGIRDLRGLLVVWFSGGITVSILVLTVGGTEDLGGRAGIGDVTLGPAYLAAAAVVVGGAALGERLIPIAVALPGTVVSGIALVMIGSRGPMIAAALGLLAWSLLSGFLRTRSILALALATAGALVGVRLASEAALSRLVLDDSTRVALWAEARTAFLDAPILGLGWGDFSTVSWIGVYPHNLFLETASELGLIGLLSLLALLIVASGRVWQNRSDPEIRVLFALAIAIFVGQQFSTDLSHRVFWIALIPCLLLPLPGRSADAA